jgi:integrase
VARLLDLVADDPLLPLWRLVTLCGLRRGEVAALRGDDFDFTDACVRITSVPVRRGTTQSRVH